MANSPVAKGFVDTQTPMPYYDKHRVLLADSGQGRYLTNHAGAYDHSKFYHTIPAAAPLPGIDIALSNRALAPPGGLFPFADSVFNGLAGRVYGPAHETGHRLGQRVGHCHRQGG
jgi:hypothetical protein